MTSSGCISNFVDDSFLNARIRRCQCCGCPLDFDEVQFCFKCNKVF